MSGAPPAEGAQSVLNLRELNQHQISQIEGLNSGPALRTCLPSLAPPFQFCEMALIICTIELSKEQLSVKALYIENTKWGGGEMTQLQGVNPKPLGWLHAPVLLPWLPHFEGLQLGPPVLPRLLLPRDELSGSSPECSRVMFMGTSSSVGESTVRPC